MTAALPPLASLPEFSRRVGQVLEQGTPDGNRAAGALADASALVRAEAGRTWIDATTGDVDLVPAEIETVVLKAARREWENPRGLGSETIADYTWRLDAGQTSVYLTEQEQAICRRYRSTGGSTGGLWSLGMTRGAEGPDTIYVPVAGGGDLLPFLHPDDVP